MFLAGYGAFVGACLASFACVISDRSSRNESYFGGRSKCVCGRQLRPWENVPVFGWVRTWGRAKCCGARIPTKYVLTEAAGALFGGAFTAQMVTWVVAGVHPAAVAFSSIGAVAALVWLTAALTWPREDEAGQTGRAVERAGP